MMKANAIRAAAKDAAAAIAAIAMCLAVAVGATPALAADAKAGAYGAPAQSANAWLSDYYMSGMSSTYYNKPMQGAITPTADGGFERVEYIKADNGDGTYDRSVHVEKYDSGFRFVSGTTLDHTLVRPSDLTSDDDLLWGGYYAGADANYVVTGHHNPNQSDSAILVRVTKFSKGWQYLGNCEISGINTYQIFTSGSLRMAELNGQLWIRTAHTMYGSSGSHHQSNITFIIDESTMKLADKSATGASSYTDRFGYVSHSWDQFVQPADGGMYAVDQGDTGPRGIIIKKLGESGTGSYNLTYKPQGSGTYTGIMLGGFETAANGAKFLISATRISTHDDSTDAMSRGPNVIAVNGTDLANATVSIKPLASYSADEYGNVNDDATNTKLVKINENRFLVMWGERHSTQTGGVDASQDGIKYVFVDADGQKIGGVRSAKARLSDVQPVVIGGKVVWYVTGISDTSYLPPQVTLAEPSVYTIDADTGEFAEAQGGVAARHTVSFDTAGGSAVDAQTVTDGAAASEPAAPTRGTWRFDGWYTAATGGEKYDFATPVHADLTLHAHWSDVTAPVLSGVDDTTVRLGQSFDEMDGVSARDDVDGDVTSRIRVDGFVDIWDAGAYELTYTVADAAGNVATHVRTVTVVDDSQATATPTGASGPTGVAVTVDSGTRPDLSGVRATVTWSDGSVTQEDVSWDEPAAADWQGRAGGDFTVDGTANVDGHAFPVQATYRVRPATMTSASVSPTELTVAAGEDPTGSLPASATVRWSNGDTTSEKVTWDAIPADKYAAAGSFDVNGTVGSGAGFGAGAGAGAGVLTVSVRITVTAGGGSGTAKPESVSTQSEITTVAGTAPALDQVKGTVYYSDGSTRQVDVVWDPVDPDKYAAAGTFEATGKVTVPGNWWPITITVNVLPKETADATAPTLVGVSDTTVEFGASFDPKAGVSAWDDRDGDLTGSITVSGSVDTKRAGEYTLTYTVSDAAGNVAKAQRKVTVKTKPGGTDPDQPEQCVPVPFTDVVDSTPHRKDIDWLSCQGITQGFKNADGRTWSFGGDRTVVRQDMAAFLYRLADSPAYTPSAADKARFTDVDESTPHHKEIWWLASQGITTGFPNADGRTWSFGGGRTVVRQDMAAFLHRFADKMGATPTLGQGVTFSDLAGAAHVEAIQWLARTGVTTGWRNADGKTSQFRGMNDVIRQDMAAFLHRMKTNVLSPAK